MKKRLIGAAVLASLAIIFVPMLFEEPPPPPPQLSSLPKKPPVQDFASEMLREEVPVVRPLVPRKSAPVEDLAPTRVVRDPVSTRPGSRSRHVSA